MTNQSGYHKRLEIRRKCDMNSNAELENLYQSLQIFKRGWKHLDVWKSAHNWFQKPFGKYFSAIGNRNKFQFSTFLKSTFYNQVWPLLASKQVGKELHLYVWEQRQPEQGWALVSTSVSTTGRIKLTPSGQLSPTAQCPSYPSQHLLWLRPKLYDHRAQDWNANTPGVRIDSLQGPPQELSSPRVPDIRRHSMSFYPASKQSQVS
jgi:hypothetical protein